MINFDNPMANAWHDIILMSMERDNPILWRDIKMNGFHGISCCAGPKSSLWKTSYTYRVFHIELFVYPRFGFVWPYLSIYIYIYTKGVPRLAMYIHIRRQSNEWNRASRRIESMFTSRYVCWMGHISGHLLLTSFDPIAYCNMLFPMEALSFLQDPCEYPPVK